VDVCLVQDQEITVLNLNKNLKRLARKSALSIKANDKSIVVLEDFNFDAVKTKSFTHVLKALEIENKKSLFVLGDVK
jgi:large subunit ribosomal protein L4